MRHIYILILMTSFTIQIHGQRILDSIDLKLIKKEKVTENDYLLDSIKIDINKLWLDPDNIKEIYFIKNGDSSIFGETSGTICIISKNKNRKWISLSDIKSETLVSANSKDQTRIDYVIDEKFIQDTSRVMIENSNITKIVILKDDKNGVNRDPPKVTYLITTKLSKQDK
jgi:hypothetical protein